MNDKSTWEFGTRQVVYGAIGAALYGVLSLATNYFPLPAAGNVTFRPALAGLIFSAPRMDPGSVCWLVSSATLWVMLPWAGAFTGIGALAMV